MLCQMLYAPVEVVKATLVDVTKNFKALFDDAAAKKGVQPQMVLLVAILCAIVPFDISQVVFMVLGAICYWFVQSTQAPVKKHMKTKVVRKLEDFGVNGDNVPIYRAGPWRREPFPQTRKSGNCSHANLSRSIAAVPQRTSTSMPIAPPVFTSTGFEAEMSELVGQIMPTPESDYVVEQLASQVVQSAKRSFPEAEVIGFASGDFRRGKAFGVAVPEVDIVINVRPEVLADRLQGRLQLGKVRHPENLKDGKLEKSAIRMITDNLVSKSGFKFRRSAFRGMEPKVTMLAPVIPGIVEQAIPLDLSVNAVLPLHNMALLTECSRIEPRAKELILVVRRWAKDRGICHSAKGHLSPYLWSLLAIYFMQAGLEEPLLPPLDVSIDTSLGVSPRVKVAIAKSEASWKQSEQCKSTATLFKEFVKFYSSQFNYGKEAVSIRVGKRQAPSSRLPKHSVPEKDGCCVAGAPSIEDPVEVTRNLGSCMNAASVARMREELTRADMLCSSNSSVGELLELWIPPEESSQQGDAE